MDIDGTVTTGQLATLLELTAARIRQLTQDGVLPKAGRGRYVLADAIVAYVRHLRIGAEAGEHSPRMRRERAEADRAELRAARERDELLPVEAHLEILYDVVNRLQSRILKIPTSWSVDVVGIKNRREAVVRLRPLTASLIETLRIVADEVEPAEANGNGTDQAPPRRRQRRKA